MRSTQSPHFVLRFPIQTFRQTLSVPDKHKVRFKLPIPAQQHTPSPIFLWPRATSFASNQTKVKENSHAADPSSETSLPAENRDHGA
jgi:hypothetical protein